MTTEFPYLGSCSTGTLRPEDLIPSFCALLTDVLRWAEAESDCDPDGLQDTLSKLEVIEGAADDDDYFESEDATYDQEWLTDMLNEYAPESVIFGSHEGDGADFGYWETDE